MVVNLIYLFPIFFLLSVILIVSSESPYFSLLGVVTYSVLASILMFFWGYVLLGWIFLIVYVGGMVVVFSFTASMSSSVFPKVGSMFFIIFFTTGALVTVSYTYLSKWWTLAEIFSCSKNPINMLERLDYNFYLIYNSSGLLLLLILVLVTSMACVYMSCLCYSKGQILRY
uniref:NADH dehydrogenase subunit 6 n=1 Tax=Xenoturbella monstrosa TaxID=1755483 RepID=A0A0U2VKW5_9BILA|nr:NADH dehydrogenase subunit 6 [Xenoturbella monstrosa]ALS20083.1 NADH dehydrogenase subunit 6 [Xenoturbella monstrosa]